VDEDELAGQERVVLRPSIVNLTPKSTTVHPEVYISCDFGDPLKGQRPKDCIIEPRTGGEQHPRRCLAAPMHFVGKRV
jgi:hypothetical protein